MIGGIVRALWAVAALSASASAQVIYVNAASPPGGDGLTWASAFSDLRDGLALSASSAGARPEVWVAQGVYRPDGGTGNRNSSFVLPNGVIVRGGFVGAETTAGERQLPLQGTVLSGDIGQSGVDTDNSYHVLVQRQLFATVEIEGLVIRDGRADQTGFPNNSGGGFLNEWNATVRDCVFENNEALAAGGGLYSRFGTATVINCAFRNNSALSEGGGAFIRDLGSVSGCVFTGNNGGFGGGLSLLGIVAVRGSEFRSNFAIRGGGLYTTLSGATVSRCRFLGNGATLGGGVYLAAGAFLGHSFFGANTGSNGAGVYVQGAAACTVDHCVFSRHVSYGSGSAVFVSTGSAAIVTSSTMSGNRSMLFGGGVYSEGASCTISNSILWGNQDSQTVAQNAQLTRVQGTLAVSSCLVEGWTGSLGGSANSASDPKFINPTGPDQLQGTEDDVLLLQAVSGGLDAAAVSLLSADVGDVDSDLNVSETVPLDHALQLRGRSSLTGGPGVPDLGAYEYIAPPVLAGDANRDGHVTFDDITTVLANFGASGEGDVNGDGLVSFDDLTMVLANFGVVAE